MEGPRSYPGTAPVDAAHSAALDGDLGATPAAARPARGLSRRNVVLGASAVGAAGLLSACGGGGSTAGSAPGADSGGSPSEDSGGSGNGGGGNGGGGSAKLATKAEVPVRGGTVNQNAKVVVTQPTSGTFKAFTAVCTHMSCLVAAVRDNVIICPCHGSEYSASDGSVKTGPATAPLAPVNVTLQGDNIVEA